MARVIPSEVLALITTSRDLWPFIETAHLLVDQYLGTVGYGEPLLTEMERWWAAHLVACAEPQVSAKQLGDTRLQYQTPQLGMGLEGTSYGQQVLLLDAQGLLQTVTTMKRTVFDVF